MAAAGVPEDAIVEEVFIKASPERVFRALTDPKELVAWWGDREQYWCTSWALDLRVGGRWRAEGRNREGQPFVVEGEIVEVDPPRVLGYTWRPSWIEVDTTTVRIVLEPKDGGTHVTWTHSGFTGRRKALEDHRRGLPSVVRWLVAFLEQGRRVS